MRRLSTIAVLSALLLAARTDAASNGPLPPFELQDLAGRPVESASLRSSGRWAIIFVKPGQSDSEEALRLLAAAHPQLPQAIHIVALGTVGAIQGYPGKAELEAISAAGWYADQSDAAFTKLELSGTPVVIALDSETVRWTQSGLPSERSGWASAITQWIDR